MNRDAVFTKLLEIFKKVNIDPSFDYSNVNEETLIFSELGLDSIGFLYMVMSIQNEFKIKIKNDQFLSLKTIADLIDLIENLQK